MSLKDVMDFEIGETLLLNAHPDSVVRLSCGGVPLMRGKMGRVGDHVAIRVTHGLQKPTHES
jgi:flagellar motor switch protein FliM